MADSFYGGKQGFSFVLRENSLDGSNGYFSALGGPSDTDQANSIYGGIKRGDIKPGEYAIVSAGEKAGEIYRIGMTNNPIFSSKVTLPTIQAGEVIYEQGPPGEPGEPGRNGENGEGCLIMDIQDFDPTNPNITKTTQQLLIINEPSENNLPNSGDLLAVGTPIYFDKIKVKPLIDIYETITVTEKSEAPYYGVSGTQNPQYSIYKYAIEKTNLLLPEDTYTLQYVSNTQPSSVSISSLYGLLGYDFTEIENQNGVYFYLGGELPPLLYVGTNARIYQCSSENFISEEDINNTFLSNISTNNQFSAIGAGIYLIIPNGLITIKKSNDLSCGGNPNVRGQIRRLGLVLYNNNGPLTRTQLRAYFFDVQSCNIDGQSLHAYYPQYSYEYSLEEMEQGSLCTRSFDDHINNSNNSISTSTISPSGDVVVNTVGGTTNSSQVKFNNGGIYVRGQRLLDSKADIASIQNAFGGNEEKIINSWDVIQIIYNFGNAYINIY